MIMLFSSTSTSWCQHSFEFVEEALIVLINDKSFVIELASNDGYLLQYVKSKTSFRIEPTQATANAAISIGIDALVEFFDSDLAKDCQKRILL